MASDSVDLIDEDYAGGILLALLKQVTNPACADTHEHFDEVGTRNREERYIGLTGNRPGQQGLTGSRRPDQEYALGNTPAKLLELLRFAQELDDLAQFLFGFVHAGNIFEGHFLLLHGEQSRTALAE